MQSREPATNAAAVRDIAADASPPSAGVSSAARQILIVEDEGLLAKDMARILIRLGYHVVARAATAEEAVHQAALWKPDVVLMDIGLRGPQDGIDAARAIYETQNIPIIFLSTPCDRPTLERALLARPYGFVVKPSRDADLQCAIEVALSRHQMETELRQREANYRRLCTVDELTGLPNRRGFCELADQQLKVACRHQQPLVLCFADLDGLKDINDTLGHAVGDDAIRAAAHVLKDTFRGSDIVARLSGDEFAILAIASAQSGLDSALFRLNENLAKFNSTPPPFHLDLSLGVARHDSKVGQDLKELISRADAAMYAQKQRKRSTPSLRAVIPTT
jgi:diguanylate cyclase (GGDEF)-like protein